MYASVKRPCLPMRHACMCKRDQSPPQGELRLTLWSVVKGVDQPWNLINVHCLHNYAWKDDNWMLLSHGLQFVRLSSKLYVLTSDKDFDAIPPVFSSFFNTKFFVCSCKVNRDCTSTNSVTKFSTFSVILVSQHIRNTCIPDFVTYKGKESLD